MKQDNTNKPVAQDYSDIREEMKNARLLDMTDGQSEQTQQTAQSVDDIISYSMMGFDLSDFDDSRFDSEFMDIMFPDLFSKNAPCSKNQNKSGRKPAKLAREPEFEQQSVKQERKPEREQDNYDHAPQEQKSKRVVRRPGAKSGHYEEYRVPVDLGELNPNGREVASNNVRKAEPDGGLGGKMSKVN